MSPDRLGLPVLLHTVVLGQTLGGCTIIEKISIFLRCKQMQTFIIIFFNLLNSWLQNDGSAGSDVKILICDNLNVHICSEQVKIYLLSNFNV